MDAFERVRVSSDLLSSRLVQTIDIRIPRFDNKATLKQHTLQSPAINGIWIAYTLNTAAVATEFLISANFQASGYSATFDELTGGGILLARQSYGNTGDTSYAIGLYVMKTTPTILTLGYYTTHTDRANKGCPNGWPTPYVSYTMTVITF